MSFDTIAESPRTPATRVEMTDAMMTDVPATEDVAVASGSGSQSADLAEQQARNTRDVGADVDQTFGEGADLEASQVSFLPPAPQASV